MERCFELFVFQDREVPILGFFLAYDFWLLLQVRMWVKVETSPSLMDIHDLVFYVDDECYHCIPYKYN